MRQSCFTTLLFLVIFAVCFNTTDSYAKCVKGDCLNGFGIDNLENGNKYAGEYKNGKRHGKGTITAPDGKWIGKGTHN